MATILAIALFIGLCACLGPVAAVIIILLIGSN